MVQPLYRFKPCHSFVGALLNNGRRWRFVAYYELVAVEHEAVLSFTRYSASYSARWRMAVDHTVEPFFSFFRYNLRHRLVLTKSGKDKIVPVLN
jgi:hypothetical protein